MMEQIVDKQLLDKQWLDLQEAYKYRCARCARRAKGHLHKILLSTASLKRSWEDSPVFVPVCQSCWVLPYREFWAVKKWLGACPHCGTSVLEPICL